MSLFDYLNSDSSSATSSVSSISTQISALLQQAQAQQGIVVPAATKTADESTATSASSSSQSSVVITTDAQRANATATDAKADAETLAAQIRATLDGQYAGRTNKTANMTAFSARALALVALNDDGKFSRAEVAAAKMELRERDRASALTFLNSGDLTASSLKAYSQQLLAARNAMSKEEQTLRDIDPNFR